VQIRSVTSRYIMSPMKRPTLYIPRCIKADVLGCPFDPLVNWRLRISLDLGFSQLRRHLVAVWALIGSISD
jgi:hypothetical protein